MLSGTRSILLRKFAGRLEACWQSAGGVCFTAGKSAPLSGIAFALVLMLVPVLAILGLMAAFVAPEATVVNIDPSVLGLAIAGTLGNHLAEKKEEFAAKQKKLADAFAAAGPDREFSRKSVLDLLGAVDEPDAVRKTMALNVELDNMGADLRQYELEVVEASLKEREAERKLPSRGGMHHAVAPDTKVRSFGDLIVESKEYTTKAANRFRDGGSAHTVEIDIKTLFERTAGFAPESPRTGLMVSAVAPPVVILDLIPTRPMNQAVDKYMEETTRTHGAAEKAEGVAYAES